MFAEWFVYDHRDVVRRFTCFNMKMTFFHLIQIFALTCAFDKREREREERKKKKKKKKERERENELD
jgi:hypothetical protein